MLAVLTSVLAIFIAILVYFKRSHQYWKNRNVFAPEPSFPLGSPQNPFTSKWHPGIQIKMVYDLARSQGHKHAGAYNLTTPVYVPVDPKIIKHIFQQDFQYFSDRGFYYNEKDDPLSANLFAIHGEKWRILRTRLSSAFTPGKMKMIYDIVARCGYQMQTSLMDNCEKNKPIEIKEVSACYTVDVIGSCVFGIECNSFKSSDAEFVKHARTIFESVTPFHLISIFFAIGFPNFGRFLGIKLFKKETTKFFLKVMEDAVKLRTTTNFVRKDILQLLIELRNEANSTPGSKDFTITELAAQAFVFFAAGFETSATTLTFCLFELSRNPILQQKLRDDINTALQNHNGLVTYDAVNEMKYMGQVLDETLRKYPPLPVLTRRCVEDYKLPDLDVVIPKGMHCLFSILGLHYDAEYYPDPEKFDPERFSVENKQKIVPFTYLPFGEGPRICIGLRLGQMQTKVALAILLKHYKFTLNPETELPIHMDPRSFTMVPQKGIFLNIEKADT